MASRREFLQKSLLAGVGIGLLGKSVLNATENNEQIVFVESDDYTVPALPYAYDALEPWIDMKTMQVHHDKHHQAYVDNLNKALKASREKNPTPQVPQQVLPGASPNVDEPEKILFNKSQSWADLENMLKGASKLDPAIRNNGGGHWNHSFFWEIMQPAALAGTPNLPTGKFAENINITFGSFEKFKEQFVKTAKERFGSGWAWLISIDGQLAITSTPNQDNPLMDTADVQGRPILGLDVWEHAYYLKYQNVRADYINNWWNVVNWENVQAHYYA